MSSFGARPVVSLDGGTDPRSGRHYRPVWGAVWGVCQANGLSPAELVETRFSMALSAVPPEPRDLLDLRIVEAANRKRAAAPAAVRNRLISQMRSLADCGRVAAVLRSPDPVAEAAYAVEARTAPLARYLYVLSAGRNDLAAVFFGEAVAEFALRRPVMEAALLGVLPPALIEAASRLYVDSRNSPDPDAPERSIT